MAKKPPKGKKKDRISAILESSNLPAAPLRLIKTQSITKETSYHGPIPDPETLARFEQVLPGLADRIVSMAENQSEHRREVERMLVEAEVRGAARFFVERRMGQVFALIIGLAGVACGTYLLATNHWATGTMLSGGTILGLAIAFITGKASERKAKTDQAEADRIAKDEESDALET